jgi:hypothetical protein
MEWCTRGRGGVIHLCLEPCPLVDRVRQLREGVCELASGCIELKALGDSGEGAVGLGERGGLRGAGEWGMGLGQGRGCEQGEEGSHCV